ncbi:unnamed protein product [Bursaphelenchus okinawaensis]|uniref:Uncharacterized protein n=1 Tax=Bursaphelenchus okinawaensis TaxID=465554 RepID=A0A811JR94_9BILA|nr:unnamed protein product [Bursaphelenchus okinawaensis]CAG9079865.1 unnamed protein product [Bursaphelenchus okinawaensis]
MSSQDANVNVDVAANFDVEGYKKLIEKIEVLVKRTVEKTASLEYMANPEKMQDVYKAIFLQLYKTTKQMVQLSSSCELKNQGCHVAWKIKQTNPFTVFSV